MIPSPIKLYHIAHVDRLPSIVATGGLLSDNMVQAQALGGTMIGMNHIKQRRLTELQLSSHSLVQRGMSLKPRVRFQRGMSLEGA